MTNRIFNPAMLTLAREARGFNQTRLAKESSVSQAHISKAEAGLVEPSSEALAALARALRVPVGFFYQMDPVLGAGTSEFFHRKRQAVPAKVLRQIHAQVNILRMHLARLLRAIELPECKIPQLEVADFKGGAAEAARAVRAALHVAPGPIPSVVRVIEDAGGVIIPVAFGTYEVDAISRWVPGMPPLFFANTSAPVDRFRMSLAHELAHMVLHRIPSPEMEAEATEFAAEFLMPAADIKRQLYGLSLDRLAALKPYWRTAMSALLVRATELRCMSPEQAQYLWRVISARGYRKREPAELDLTPEPPTLLREMIEYYRRDLGYSIEDLATALMMDPAELMGTYSVVRTKPEAVKQFRRVK